MDPGSIMGEETISKSVEVGEKVELRGPNADKPVFEMRVLLEKSTVEASKP